MGSQAQQSPSPSIQSQPLPKSRFPLIILGPLLLIVVSVTSFLLGQRSIRTTKQNEPIPTTTVSITSPALEISNWKTYSDSKYHLSFKYPPDWVLTNDQSTWGMSPNSGIYRILVSSGEFLSDAYEDLSVTIDIMSKNDLESEIANYKNSSTDWDETVYRYGNVTIQKAIFMIKGRTQSSPKDELMYSSNGNLGLIIYIQNEVNSSFPTQILSTLTFLDKNQSNIWIQKKFGSSWDIGYPTDWKINEAGLIEGNLSLEGSYKNYQYSIGLGYPIFTDYNPPGLPESLDVWVNKELSYVPEPQKSLLRTYSTTVAGTQAKKVINMPAVVYDDGTTRRFSETLTYKAYLWKKGEVNPRIITISQIDGTFNSGLMEELFDIFLSKVK